MILANLTLSYEKMYSLSHIASLAPNYQIIIIIIIIEMSSQYRADMDLHEQLRGT